MTRRLRYPDPQKLLVIKLGALGDIVQAFGPLAAIRRHHPRAHLTVLTTAPYESLMRACPYVDDVMIDTRPRAADFTAWWRLWRALQARRFERVYDLQNNDRTALYLRLLAGADSVGAARGATIRNAAPDRTAGHAFDGHAQTLALAGIADVRLDDLSWMTADLAGFALPPRFVLLVPGAAPSRPRKRWPPAHYAALAHDLDAAGLAPVIIGTAADADAAAVIVQSCPAAIDLCGRTDLSALPMLARAAVAAVGNDTGPMHMIAAAGCPALVLFSHDSDPARHAPRGRDVQTLRVADLADLPVAAVWRALARFV